MKFTISTVLWVVTVFGGIFFGWHIRDSRDPLTPVLVASRGLKAHTFVLQSDFRVEMLPSSSVPEQSLRQTIEVQGRLATTENVKAGQAILPSTLEDVTYGEVLVNIASHHRLYTVHLNNSNHSLTNHLLSPGDYVSVHAIFDVGADQRIEELLIRNAKVFSKLPGDNNTTEICLLITKSDLESLENAEGQAGFSDFEFDAPDKDG